MPYTDKGIFYPDGATLMSVAGISEAVAESINDNLGMVRMVYSTTNEIVPNSSRTSYGSSGLSVRITPNSAANGFFVIVRMPFEASVTTGFWSGADFVLRRNNVDIAVSSPGITNINDQPNGSPFLYANTLSIAYMDYPNTIEEVEYTVLGKIWNNTPTPTAQNLQMNYASGAASSSMIIMEVAR